MHGELCSSYYTVDWQQELKAHCRCGIPPIGPSFLDTPKQCISHDGPPELNCMSLLLKIPQTLVTGHGVITHQDTFSLLTNTDNTRRFYVSYMWGGESSTILFSCELCELQSWSVRREMIISTTEAQMVCG